MYIYKRVRITCSTKQKIQHKYDNIVKPFMIVSYLGHKEMLLDHMLQLKLTPNLWIISLKQKIVHIDSSHQNILSAPALFLYNVLVRLTDYGINRIIVFTLGYLARYISRIYQTGFISHHTNQTLGPQIQKSRVFFCFFKSFSSTIWKLRYIWRFQ